MADPLSWQVVQALATDFAAIAVADGYYTDLGDYVTTERTPATDDAPQLALGTPRHRSQSVASGLREHLYEVTVEAFLPSAGPDQALAHQALDDLRAIYPEVTDVTLSGGATAHVEIVSAEIFARPPGAGGISVQALITATVREVLA